jgi:hypothetical protein
MAAYQAAQLLDDLRCQPRFAGRVHESIELVVQVEGLKTGRERRRSAIRAGCSQAKVYMTGIVDGADTVQDAREAEHGRMRCLMVPVTALSTTAFLTAPTNSSGVIHQ